MKDFVMADDKIDILEIRETSELLVGNKMADDKVDIMEVPVAAEKSVDVPEILEISELQVGNKMTDDKIDVPKILETSEFQVGDIIVVPEISENSEFKAGDIMAGDIMAEEKIDVSEIPENSEFEILGDEKIDVLPENSELDVSGDIKRFSTGYAVVTNRAMIIRSRYLKATMGSCHDLCKHGIRHAAEEEDGKNPKIKRSISLKSVILAGRNKQLALDRKPDSQGLGNATSQRFNRSITFQGLETVQEKNASATLDHKSSLESVGISEGNEGSSLETIQKIVTSEELARDNNNYESRELDYDPSSVVTSLPDKVTPPSKSGLLPPEDIDVIPSKHATVLNLKTNKLLKPTPGSLKSIRVSESRKTKENGASPMNSAGKDKKLMTSKKVLVPPPVVSSPKRSLKKLASVTNVKSPKKNLVGRSNKTNASKLKPMQKNSEDIPEKTLYIIESSVNISDDSSPSLSSSSENKISKHVRNNEQSPPPVEKKNLRTPATRSRSIPSSETKGSYGSRAAKSSSRQNESNRQKVHLKKTPTATRSLPALSTEKKVFLRHTQYRTPVSPASTEKKVVLRHTQHDTPVSPALSTEKNPVLRRTQFSTPVSRSSASPASLFPSRYSVSSRKSSQHDQNGPATQKSNLKVKKNKSIITKRTVVNHSDKDSVALKLKFRRGKVIEPQSTEVVAPRRLKFQRRVIVDSILGKGDTESRRSKKGEDESKVEIVAPIRLTFKRRVIVDSILGKGDTESRSSIKGDDESKVEIDSIQSESSNKIMLKHHQDVVERKRDFENKLYNNVIEETASKLVETRKSKVKALVGAFETVISLQEKKPN